MSNFRWLDAYQKEMNSTASQPKEVEELIDLDFRINLDVAVYLRSLLIRAAEEKNIPRPSRELMNRK